DGLAKAGAQGLPDGSISEIVFNLASWLLILLGSFAVIGFVISGILYLTSAGNEDRMETAKKGMIYSIIGVIVGLLGYIIVQAVDTWFRVGSVDF
ncbi:MAG: pilin, partial [Patescibacteria group bacterium]|nr:pilin [Patescibacteria group bacterium]